MQVQTRQFRQSDTPDLTELFNHPEVVRNITQLPYGTEEQWLQRLKGGEESSTLVADLDGTAVGCITLFSERSARRKHVASLAMAVSPAHHRKGVGTQLIQAAMLLADDWMNFARIELGVFTSNRGAIKLYDRFGFKIEGEARAYAFGEGSYQNLLYMARVQHSHRAKRPSIQESAQKRVPAKSMAHAL